MLTYQWAVTQEQQAISDGALLADAQAGWALIRSLAAEAEAVRIETDGLFDAGWPLSDDEVDELMADAPADFAEAVQEYEDKGAQYVAPGIDWAAVEDGEAVGLGGGAIGHGSGEDFAG